MGRVWLSSDHHFGHKSIAVHRGFGEDVDAHDETICENYSKVIREDDIVYFLGDISVGGLKNETHALDIIKRLPGRKRIIYGNHDSPSAIHSKPWKYISLYQEVFEWGGEYLKHKIDGRVVELCHYPFKRDHTSEPRFPEHRRPDYGQFICHGHVHDDIVKQGKQIHIGLDAHGLNPVSQEEVLEYMDDPATFIVRSPSTGELRKVYA